MQQIRKLFKIIVVFLVSFLLITLVWYIIEKNFGSNSTGSFADFLLYLLGYGDVKNTFEFSKIFFTIFGLLAVTLLSSVFTVNLFELRNKLIINPKLMVYKKDAESFDSAVLISANRKDICDIKLNLIAGIGNEVVSQKYYIPFISKSASKLMRFSIEPGTPVYKFLRSTCTEEGKLIVLVLTASYTDIDTGQRYMICQRFFRNSEKGNDVVFADAPILGKRNPEFTDKSYKLLAKSESSAIKKDFEEFITNNAFAIDLSGAMAINASDIDIRAGKSELSANVHMDGNNKEFTMACIKRPLGGNWSEYLESGCGLKFDYQVTGNIRVNVEVKSGNNELSVSDRLLSGRRFVLEPYNDVKQFYYEFSEKDEKYLKDIDEICFTVFYEDVNPTQPTGEFYISNCAVERQ